MATFWTIVGAIALPLLLAFTFRVFLMKPADATREYLARQRSGWQRRRYVRIFVEAISGTAKADDSISAARIEILYAFVLGALALTAIGNYKSKTSELNSLLTRIDSVLQGIRLGESKLAGDAPDTPNVGSTADLAEQKKDALKIREDIQAANNNLSLLFWFGIAVYCVSAALAVWLTAIRFPFVRFRSRFAYELERFTLRIQGLADKQELAELVKKEVAVRNEQTAKEFVDVMAKIATRHGVESLVDTFLLWGPPADKVLPQETIPTPHSKPAEHALPQPAHTNGGPPAGAA